MKMIEKLTNLLISKDYQAFDDLANSKEAFIIIPHYNLALIKLSKAFITKDEASISSLLNTLKNMKLSQKQKFHVYSRAFYYYLIQKDLTNSQTYYKLIQKNGNSEDLKEFDILYDVSDKYLDSMLNALKSADTNNTSDVEELIAAMYENKGEPDTAQKYYKLSQEHKANR